MFCTLSEQWSAPSSSSSSSNLEPVCLVIAVSFPSFSNSLQATTMLQISVFHQSNSPIFWSRRNPSSPKRGLYSHQMKMTIPPPQQTENDRSTAELRALDCNLTSLCDHIQMEGFNSGAFSDVVVHAMGSTYHLHRLILSRSSYFRFDRCFCVSVGLNL